MREADRTTRTNTTASKRRQAKLRSDALGSFLDNWEAKHGDLTPEELTEKI
jgi:hypothetical protein